MILSQPVLSIIDSLHIGIIILDKSLRITYTNSWVTNRFDSSSSFSTGQLITDLGESSERFIDSLVSARDSGRSSLISCKLNKLPFRLVHGGVELSFNLIVSRIDSPNDENSILIQVLDVTQVKQREDFLIDKQKEVDLGRVKSFNQERLVSLGELSSSMAHEINNPLAILELNNKTLEKILKNNNVLTPEINEVFKDGKDSLKRVKDLVVSIKNLARNSENEEFTITTLDSVIQDILPVLSTRAISAGIDLKYNSTDPGFNTSISCVRSLLGQVFVNMFTNSFYEVKKFDKKWIEIESELNKETIQIFITDSGTGIPKEIRDKIFLPFYTTKGIGEGTGLGLSTVFRIIEIHSGSIKLVENHPNTRFVITLPLARKP